MTRYTLCYRPPSTCTLPRGIGWTLVERPSAAAGFDRRTDLPVSVHPFGVVTFDRALTPAEVEQFELREVAG